ncbi:MAG: EpsG family protein [Candidatus Pelagibacter sp.]|nr:EpsG family protein [Candidatus Pelagibacter sp.]
MIEIFTIISGIFVPLSFFNLEFKKKELIIVLILIFGIIFFDGLRWEMGTDWFNYLKNFQDINIRWTPGFEFGFQIYTQFISLLTENYSIYLFITSFLFYIGIFYNSYKISGNSFITLFLLFATITWYSGGQRQMLACAIFLFSIKYIINRNLTLFLILSFLGLSFHITFIVLIPFYFIYGMSNRKFYLTILLLIVLSHFIYPIIEQFANFFNFFNPGKDLTERFDGGLETSAIFGFGRKIVTTIPVIYFYHLKPDIKNNIKIRFFYHLSLFSIFIYILGFNYIGILASRLDIYFGIISLAIFLGLIQSKLKVKQHKIFLIIFCFFLAILHYSRLADWGMSLYHPYSSIFYNYYLNRVLF